MFQKQDYKNYCGQLYAIEMNMKKEAKKMYPLIRDPASLKILRKIIREERKHEHLVKRMMKLVS